jgi:Flp pilus assembly protein TadD
MARRPDPFLELTEELIYYETPELRARRARLRRVVVGTLSVSVALLLVGILARYGAEKTESVLDTSSLRRTATLNALLPQETHLRVASVSAPAPAAPALTIPSPAGSVVADSASPNAQASAPLTDDPSALTRAARALLAAGHTREGVAAARTAVAANPSDAEPYILLATGLQDLGNWPEAHAVFTACEQKAERGPNASCRYFAGR